MRKPSSVMLAILLSAAMITACSEDSSPVDTDPIVQTDMELSGFTKIDIKDGIPVVVNIQGETDVKVNFNESIRDYVKVLVADSTLKIEVEGVLSRVEGKTYNVTVGMPFLKEVSITDGSMMTINSTNVTGPGFKSDLKEGSKLIGKVTTFDFEIKADNGSSSTLSGSATTGKLTLDHGSTIDLRDFVLLTGDVDAKNGSTVYVNVTGTLDVKADGGSKIYYRGSPTLGEVDLKGGSTLEAF